MTAEVRARAPKAPVKVCRIGARARTWVPSPFCSSGIRLRRLPPLLQEGCVFLLSPTVSCFFPPLRAVATGWVLREMRANHGMLSRSRPALRMGPRDSRRPGCYCSSHVVVWGIYAGNIHDYPRHDRIRLRGCRSGCTSVIGSAASHMSLASGVTSGMRAPHSVRAPAGSGHRTFFQVTLCAAGGLQLRVHAVSTSHAVLASASRQFL